MKRVAALLAAALLGTGLVACGGGGAEPGAPKGATLVLDFQPNAVHAGIYAAQANGDFRDEGVDLHIQEPSSTADSAKLLQAGRADFAVMDINDFGIARERGLDLVAVAGKTIGVTGVPSDDAVLDTVLRSGGVDPSDVHRVTIGFNAVADLAAGKVDAATGFWNAEGVQLQQMGIPIREFRVDEFGAPRYPELVVATRRQSCPAGLALLRGLNRGYAALGKDPGGALNDLLDQVPGLDRRLQGAQLNALVGADAFDPAIGTPSSPRLSAHGVTGWLSWAERHGIVRAVGDSGTAVRIGLGFQPGVRAACGS